MSVKWIPAPTSGILHVAGKGFPRRECKPGVQLLCGWVLTSDAKQENLTARNDPRIGKKCRTCERWLEKHPQPSPGV